MKGKQHHQPSQQLAPSLLLQLFLLLFLSSFLYVGCRGSIFHITNSSDFITFSKNVDAGIDYKGTTVLLDKDISFSGESLSQIGTFANSFAGTFDGQGHTLSSASIASSSFRVVGLFGAIDEGGTVQNVILDGTCTITSTFALEKTTTVFIGGVVGYCYSNERECIVRNAVNMGAITFTGNQPEGSLLIGGIIGRCVAYTQKCSVTNCANFGDILHAGTTNNAYIGGLVGAFIGSSAGRSCTVANSLNYGDVAVNELSGNSETYIGGLFGCLESNGYSENCVNFGHITSNIAGTSIGGCGGYLSNYANVYNNFWSDEIGHSEPYGYGSLDTNESSTFDSDFNLLDDVTLSSVQMFTLMEALNTYIDMYSTRGYSRWLLNKDNKEVTFVIGSRNIVTYTSQLIVLPDLWHVDRLLFDGWYTDKACVSPLSTFETSADMKLYGTWEESERTYTISFDTDGGTPVDPISAQFGTIVNLSAVVTTKDGYGISRWEDEEGGAVSWSFEVPARSTELRVVWIRTRISTPGELAEYSEAVLAGKAADLTTVLDADIDFDGYDGSFMLIGAHNSTGDSSFRGTFDGQGHKISNMEFTSSRQFAGLFGYSAYGATIRNLVFDSTCGIENVFTLSGFSGVTAGFLGYCEASSAECVIENCVNMAYVTYSGVASGITIYATIGGFMGMYMMGNYYGRITNCANLGSVKATNTNYGVVIGGIVGEAYGNLKVKNCINSGYVMTTSGTLVGTEIGGIVGSSNSGEIENCVNIGSVSSADSKKTLGYIVGNLYGSTMANCFGTTKNNYPLYGTSVLSSVVKDCLTFDTSAYELSSQISVGSYFGNSLIAALNSWAEVNCLSGYSGWLLNANSKTIKFSVDDEVIMSYTSALILLPKITSIDQSKFFDAWYADSDLQTTLETSTVTKAMTVYGGWVSKDQRDPYTLTFNTTGGTEVASQTLWYSDVISLPSGSTKEGYRLVRWVDEYGNAAQWLFTMPKRNITLYAVWVPLELGTPTDFENFVSAVRNGMTFSGETVYLCNDVDLSNLTVPVGYGDNVDLLFQGTFDGQGYTISGLNISSDEQGVGLFVGSVSGVRIANLVLDATCAITSTYTDSHTAYIGGVLGTCAATATQCVVENCVNMASVTFTGEATDNSIVIGGVVGCLSPSQSYECIIRNCVNYGIVANKGNGSESTIGGVIGQLSGEQNTGNIVQSCFNHGPVSHTGDLTSRVFIGGVFGYISYGRVEGCANVGNISARSPQATGDSMVIGSVGGGIWMGSKLSCYWLRVSGLDGICSLGEEVGSFESFDEDFMLASGTSVVATLNAYADNMQDFSRWYLNRGENSVTLRVNGREVVTYTSQIILAAGLARNGKMSFGEWTSQLNITDYEITEATTLDGTWDDRYYGKSFTVSFNTGAGGEAIEPITAVYGTVVDLPKSATRDGYLFLNWAYSNGSPVSWSLAVPGRDVELHAVWKVLVISSGKDLVDFMKGVNMGYNYTGVTVTMRCDVDVSEYASSLVPIGYNANSFFSGTFDGQGYVISGFKLVSSLQMVALFGVSMTGTTIRNVILDESCSMTSTFNQVGSYENSLAGILAFCKTNSRECVVDKCVNMASISFKGNSVSTIGGIVGTCIAENYNCRMDSSMNYGTILHAGTSTTSIIGGLIGVFQVFNDSQLFNITNGVNSGAIEHSGTTSATLIIGGVIGNVMANGHIHTCVSTGNISDSSKKKAQSTYLGGIVGMSSKAYIANCYWSDLLDYPVSAKYQNSYHYDNYKFGSDLVVKDNRDTDFVALLESLGLDSTIITFDTNGGDPLSPLIIFFGNKNFALPTPKKGERMFIGWYFDQDFAKPFDVASMEGKFALLYARWTNYDVSSVTESVYVQLITRDLKKDDVTTTIEKIAGCDSCYNIEEFNDYGSKAFTIIKFVNVETSKEFVRNVNNDYGRLEANYIVRIYMDEMHVGMTPTISTGILFVLNLLI